MGCFFCRRDADGNERWWLEVLGKGNKEGLVPASAEMMVELGRYRRDRRAVDRKRGCRDRGSWRLHVLNAAPPLEAIDGTQKERADRSPPFPIS